MRAKPFYTYTQQIEELEKYKGLIIPDKSKAKAYLRDVGYFKLIGGGKDLLRLNTGKYIAGVSFDDVIALYEFDNMMREIFFHYICLIEKKLRSVISYEFCKVHGENQAEYLNKNNYKHIVSNKERRDLKRFLDKMIDLANSNKKYPFINYQRSTYNNVPLWVLVNAMTFGELSKMYDFLDMTMRYKISTNFENISPSELAKYLKVLGLFRNVCAHHERFYAHVVHVDIPDTLLHLRLGIPKNNKTYNLGKKDVFSLVIAFKYFLTKQDFLIFKQSISKVIAKFLNDNSVVNEQELLLKMGFPNNWKSITRYRKIR